MKLGHNGREMSGRENAAGQAAGIWRSSEKLYLLVFGCLLLGLMLWDLAWEERFFSERENRLLQQKPELSWQGLLDGTWGREYEKYLTDQFPARDAWIGFKTRSEKALGRKDINGVYLAEDGYLIERHGREEIDGRAADHKLKRLKEDIAEYEVLLAGRNGEEKPGGSVRVMLVPTADMILTDKLPAFAEDFDQLAYIRGITDSRIPVENTLREHDAEEIYYRTDHHWTTLGAYYGYKAWAESVGTEPLQPEDFERRVISDSFLGTLESKLNLPVAPDIIEIFEPAKPYSCSYEVRYDGKEAASDSLYAWSHLDTRNQYGVFLDDNHALIEINTMREETQNPALELKNNGQAAADQGQGGTLLVIKDSYANCFLPFLTVHYDKIYVMDKRYYRGSAAEYIAEQEDIENVLILYDVIHFIENY